MFFVGIDDTDTLEDPGTNQLARHLVRQLSDRFHGQMIVRHQLLEDPRVPCTKKNGCASLSFICLGDATLDEFVVRTTDIMRNWCPQASDPGLCVASEVPEEVVAFGQRCQHELVTQQEARDLAARHNIFLAGLGGTEDGVIGALAAVGLLTTRNDGRVVHLADSHDDLFEVTGTQSVESIYARGVDDIVTLDSRHTVRQGLVEIGKRLRPNLRGGRIVLYVEPVANGQIVPAEWQAVRQT